MAGTDPVFVWLARSGIALLFLVSATHKLRDWRAFVSTVSTYALLPSRGVPAASAAIAAGEIIVAPLVMTPATASVGAALAAALLCVYSVAIVANLFRGRRDIDCGCLGPGRTQPISAWLVLRNGLLALGAGLAGFGPGGRTLAWVDGVSIAAGLLVLSLLFVASNALGAQATTLQRLGRSM